MTIIQLLKTMFIIKRSHFGKSVFAVYICINVHAKKRDKKNGHLYVNCGSLQVGSFNPLIISLLFLCIFSVFQNNTYFFVVRVKQYYALTISEHVP